MTSKILAMENEDFLKEYRRYQEALTNRDAI
jgi:hypothetical protein